MRKLNRRQALGVAVAASGAIASGAVRAAEPLSVTIEYMGQKFEYREDQSVDIGSFTSDIGGFTQRCLRSRSFDFPITVYFRPDTVGDRAEIVFELGRLFSGTPQNLGAYTATITRGAVQLAQIAVPAHYWFSRWRWQSAPRPVVASFADLIARKLLPPIAPSSAALPAFTRNPYTVMGFAGLQAYMPSTGERPEIGLVTEPQGRYIATGNSAVLDVVRDQAEASGTAPWHMRDEYTGAPVDFRNHPDLTWYPGATEGTIVSAPATPVSVDSSHMPALSYVPYVLTGDPYHLEELQFQANWNWGSLPSQFRPSVPQVRALAWTLRSLAQCARITPATVPSWLLPQSYWYDQLVVQRMFIENRYVNSSDPVSAIFRSTFALASTRDDGPGAAAGTWASPWQDDFAAAVFGWMVSMGFTDWRTVFDWQIGSTIARTGTTSGWVRAASTPYHMILRATATEPVASSWSEAWALTQQITDLVVTDPDTWANTDMTYLEYTRGALVYAVALGVPGASDNLAWATSQLFKRNWSVDFKWRLGNFDAGQSAPQPQFPQATTMPAPVVEPPPGVDTMTVTPAPAVPAPAPPLPSVPLDPFGRSL